VSSLSKALSLETGESLTAEEASRLFIQRTISDKRKFICIDENCSALITCANMDKPSDKRKVDPYFRTVEEHSAECQIYKTEYQNTVDLGSEGETTEQNKDKYEPDTLFISRPNNHFIEKRATPNHEGIEIVTRKSSNQSGNEINLSGSNFYHIGHVISRYHTYKSESLLYKRYLSSEDKLRTYGELFKHLKFQSFTDYAEIPTKKSIYWGTILKVFKLSNGDIKIDLVDKAKFKTAPVYISIFIKKNDYEAYRFKRPIKQSIHNLINRFGNRYKIYVYCAPHLEVKNKVFINFRPTSLDLLEVTEI
jgi:hypothetical protein